MLLELITDIRKEISCIWEQCKISEDEKKLFKEFESCEFTEEMLHIHKEELERWRVYHKKNHEILLKVLYRYLYYIIFKILPSSSSEVVNMTFLFVLCR